MSDRERALLGPRALKEPGSPEWCWQTVDYLKSFMPRIDKEWQRAQEVYDELLAERAWEVIPPEDPYGTVNKMLKAEVGLDRRTLEARIRQARLDAHGGDRRSAGFQSSNVTLKTDVRGNNQTYTIRRLRSRGRPDLADLVERGEMSARRAATEAGFRSARPTLTVRADDAQSAFDTLCGNRKKGVGMDREQLILLAKLLQEHLLAEKEN